MDSEEKVACWIVGFVCLLISVGATSCSDYHKNRDKLLLENGYEQVMEVGYSSPLWKKVTQD